MADSFIFGLLLLLGLSALYGALSAAPWLPSKRRDIMRIIEAAQIKGGEKFYDLGCGDGRLVFAAARRGARAEGIEIFVAPYLAAKIRSWFMADAKISYGDFFHKDLSDADAVVFFLLPKSHKRLVEKFERELREGTRVIAHCWPIEGWENKLKRTDCPSEKKLPIYIYQK